MPTDFSPQQKAAFALRLKTGMAQYGYDKRGGLTRFAERYGVQPPVVTDWRKGRYMPEHSKARQMAQEFECSADWFYYGEGEPPRWLGKEAKTTQKVFTKERRAIDDVEALQIALESLAVALCKTQQGAAEAFLADVNEAAKERQFSLKRGLLGKLVGIATAARNTEAAVAEVRQRAGSARRTKP